MVFHGSEIKIEDKVYDLAFSWGTVKLIDEGRKVFTVMFGNRRIVYDVNGKCSLFTNPTLFWANPLYGIKPDKELKYWSVFINTAATLSSELLKLRD